MNEKTLFKTNDYISFIKDNGFTVTVDKEPDSSTIERIKQMIAYKKALFVSLQRLFN